LRLRIEVEDLADNEGPTEHQAERPQARILSSAPQHLYRHGEDRKHRASAE